jgi:glyoxylase-like metal-dependent hydrolase (beta-lactamase superfamily II)
VTPSLHRMPLPTPFAVGAINCYLIEDDPLTLVDAGPNSGTALVALEAGLAERGRRIEDLERLVLTHQHMDHMGLAHIVEQRSGATVLAWEELAPWLADYDARSADDITYQHGLMLRHGVPADVATALRSVARLASAWGEAVEGVEPLGEGAALSFAGGDWTVSHRPGHSPSDIVLVEPEAGILIAGDHLLRDISSNALITRPLTEGEPTERPRPLLTYLDSLARTQTMDLTVVHGGHGPSFEDHRKLIDERLRGVERRAAKIGKLLEAAPRSAHAIAQELWGSVAITEAYLTLSEVLGHLDVLLVRGEIVEREDEAGTAVFAPA